MFDRLDKLQKLVRLYISARDCGVDGEADAALHMIQKLLKKYRINMSINDIVKDTDSIIKNIILIRKFIQPWIERLGSAVSELFSVQFFLCRSAEDGLLRLEFRGHATDVSDATLIFNSLKCHIISAIKEFKRTQKKTKKQVRSFAIGCSDSIYEYCHTNKIVNIQSELILNRNSNKRISRSRLMSVDRFSYKQGKQIGNHIVNQQLKQQTKG